MLFVGKQKLFFPPSFLVPELLQAVELWDNKNFQDARTKMGHFEYSESLEYVMQHLERLVDSNWELSNDDILIARQRTTGLSCTNFMVRSYPEFRTQNPAQPF